MTWVHWVLFAVLSVLALGVSLDNGGSAKARLSAFVALVGMILLLILGQPK